MIWFEHIWHNWSDSPTDDGDNTAFNFYSQHLNFTFPDPSTDADNEFFLEYLTRSEIEVNFLLDSKIIDENFFNALSNLEKNHVRVAIAKLISFRFATGVYNSDQSGSVAGISAHFKTKYSTESIPKDIIQELSSLSFFQPNLFVNLYPGPGRGMKKTSGITLNEAKTLFMELFLTNHKTAILDVAQKVIDSQSFKDYIANHPAVVSPKADVQDGSISLSKLAVETILALRNAGQKIFLNDNSVWKTGSELKNQILNLIADIAANTSDILVNKEDIKQVKPFKLIGEAQLKDGAVTDIKISDTGISGSKIKNNTLGEAKLTAAVKTKLNKASNLDKASSTDFDVEKNTHILKYDETVKITIPEGCTNFTLKFCLKNSDATIEDDLTGVVRTISPKELFWVFNNSQWGHKHLFEDYLTPFDRWDAYVFHNKSNKTREYIFRPQQGVGVPIHWRKAAFDLAMGTNPKMLVIPFNPSFIKETKIEVVGAKNFIIPQNFSKLAFKKTATDTYFDEHEIKIKKINEAIGEISTAHSAQETLTLKAQFSQNGNIVRFRFPSIVDKFYKLLFFDDKNTEVYNLVFDSFHEKIICNDKIVRSEVNFNFDKPFRDLFISWKSWKAENWSTLKIIAFGATSSSMFSNTRGFSLPFAETQTKKNSDLINANHPAKGLILPHFPLFYIEYKTGKWKVLNNGYLKLLNWNNATKVLTIELKSKILGGWIHLSGRFNSNDDSPEIWLMPNGQGSYKAKFYEGYDNAYSKYTYSSSSRPFILQKYNKSAGEGIIEKCRFVLNGNNMDFSTKILDVDNDFRTSNAYGKYTGNSPFKSTRLIFKFRSKNIGANTVTDGTFFGANLVAGVVE